MSSHEALIVGRVWAVLIGLLLLLLLGAGLQHVWHTLLTLERQRRRRLAHGYVALALSVFVAYDLCVYGWLVLDLPYTPSPLGAARFVLDIVMAFCIYLLVRKGTSADPWSGGREIVIALVTWHLLAVLWHMIGNSEHNRALHWGKYVPHLTVASIYVGGYVGIWRRRSQLKAAVRRFDQRFVLSTTSVTIVFSAFRLWQVVSRF